VVIIIIIIIFNKIMTQPSVILATASYDHTIRFWEAKSGRCYRTIQYPDSVITKFFSFVIKFGSLSQNISGFAINFLSFFFRS
jgi:WD40 repeat protein